MNECFCDAKCLQYGDCCEDFIDKCVSKDCNVKFKEWLGDGKCDSSGNGHDEYNTAECFWDGGDCCRFTCNSSSYSEYECGSADIGYECKQPGQCATNEADRLGDGRCDLSFNTKTCSWDGKCAVVYTGYKTILGIALIGTWNAQALNILLVGLKRRN